MILQSRIPLSPLYQQVQQSVSTVEWMLMAPVIEEIRDLKASRRAIVLAHNYMRPEIFHTVADVTGDSLALARTATGTEADVIVMAGVHFMAETAKILNPDKTVLIPDRQAGCSLADSITPEDIRTLRAQYPNAPVCVYVNTSAAVKAEADICCTSGNAVRIIEHLRDVWNAGQVLFLPDQYLAAHVASQVRGIDIIPFHGACEVHEQYTPQDINSIRDSYDGDLTVIAHPECPQPVIHASDFAGSTADMVDFLSTATPKRVLLITECSMGDNLISVFPKTEFIRSCRLCPHMKRITLENIVESLRSLSPAITIAPDIAERARISVERMLLCS